MQPTKVGNPAYVSILGQVLDAVNTDSSDDPSYGATKPPVAPSSSIIKVDSGVDVRSLVRNVA
jgi:hypothetical protein